MIKGIIGAIIGSAITGVITIICELVKTRHQDKKEKIKESTEIFSNRPELKIVDYKNYIDNPGRNINENCDVDIFISPIDRVTISDQYIEANYNLNYFNRDDWCCVIYTLKNVGKTDISNFDFMTTNKRTSCLFCSDYAIEFAKDGLLNYSYCFDEKIRVNETFTLKICYYKDKIATGMFSATVSIGMVDSFHRYWQQPLFAPYEKIYDSYKVDGQKYFTDIKTDDAEECFRKPYLW